MDTAEYKAISNDFPEILLAIEDEVEAIASSLHETLASSVLQFIENSNHEQGSRARKLLSTIKKNVQLDKEVFYIFIQALRDRGKRIPNQIADKLEQAVKPASSASMQSSQTASLFHSHYSHETSVPQATVRQTQAPAECHPSDHEVTPQATNVTTDKKAECQELNTSTLSLDQANDTSKDLGASAIQAKPENLPDHKLEHERNDTRGDESSEESIIHSENTDGATKSKHFKQEETLPVTQPKIQTNSSTVKHAPGALLHAVKHGHRSEAKFLLEKCHDPTVTDGKKKRRMDELSSHLHSHGLEDCDFWLHQLNKLGIQSMTKLASLEGDIQGFSKLKAKTRNEDEKKALRKLFKIDKLEPKKNVKAKTMIFIRSRKGTATIRQEMYKEKEPHEQEKSTESHEINSGRYYSAKKSGRQRVSGLKHARLQQESKYKEKHAHTLKKVNKNSLRNVLTTPTQIETTLPEQSYLTIFSEDKQDAFALLKSLGLWKYYPKGLQLQDALRISVEPLKLSLGVHELSHAEQDLKKLPYLILHKLMAYDLRCRTHLLPTVSDSEGASEEDESDSEKGEDFVENDSDAAKSESKNDSDDASTKFSSTKKVLLNVPSSDGINLACSTSGDNNFSDTEPSSDCDDSDVESFKSCHSSLSSLIPYDVPDKLHPVDCLLSLIICSDDFLRQDLFSRLAKCQLAVPFILPDPFTKELTLPLWGLRSIIKEWECMNECGKLVKKTQPIISYNSPIVTFIRIGKNNDKSKSAILNEVISDSHYDHFFHRDCEGGNYKQLLGEGLVDMCWYLPAKMARVFPDAVTFLNLHGDARDHPQQMKFLSQISFMCFVLLTEEDLEVDSNTAESLKQFGSSKGSITILGSEGITNIPKLLKKKTLIDIKKKNVAEIKKAIRSRINKKLKQATNFQSIDDFLKTEVKDILVDEMSTSYRQGLRHATDIKQLITSHQLLESTTHKTEPKTKCGTESSIKDTFLPLQSEGLWKAWAANDKENQRQIQRGNKGVNEYSEEIKSKMAAIRKKQLEHVESLIPVMESFIVSLLELGGPSNRILRNYFLQCLKLELNNISRQSISGLQQQYQAARKELSILQEKNDSHSTDSAAAAKTISLRKELEDLQENIISSSFGLEHLFRELGQVYEAAASEPGLYRDKLSRLPKAAAELLIEGYPLELMDGDAAHVPLQWVTAVLSETIEILNNPNIFVLSVLGLQSTGKSTMLNTSFGLQFNVSAGRCTRGAFMQLLPLDEEIRSQSRCKYVLIVDTEGLRAPELDPLKTQNELTTFVIGLANMTLINIYGEVPGDMDDILQTSVHAFLRMTKIKFSSSCQFVHQNAGASVSSDVRRVKFTKKLNQFTIEAAKQEKCEGKFKCFNDVIKFNDQSDVHHFPGLWKGDPPMAPVNQGYSHSAQMLKLNLIDTLCKRSSISSFSEEVVSNFQLSTFKVRVEDLWAALIKENFVFHFKNIQEITAYNSLEIEYSKLNWKFREAMLIWEQEAENEISAVEAESASDLAEQKCRELQEYISSLHEPIKMTMKSFFEGNQSEILVQWKAKFERRFENLIDDLRSHAEKHCRKLGKNREVISKLEQDKKHLTAMITHQVQDYVASIKKEQEEFDKSLSERKLNESQLEEILRRELFTHSTLSNYREQGLISEDQLEYVEAVIDYSNGQLSTEHLKEIMFGGVLGLKQVKKIEKETDAELEAKFNTIWNDLIKHIPSVSSETITTVDLEIEKILIEFAQAKGYESQLIAKLQEENLTWDKLELIPQETAHYTKVKTSLQKLGQAASYLFARGGKTRSTDDPHLIAALQVTKKVFDKAHQCLKRITEQKTDFKPVFTKELLLSVDAAIKEESETVKDQLIFTPEYQYTVFIIVCRHAIPKFQGMAESFMERTDPQLYLKKHVRKPLFTKFKNQYHQTKAEEAIASTLCAFLEEPIKEQIKQTIGAIMVGKMRASEYHFASKMALKVKILTDFHKEDDYDYEGYMTYVRNVKKCLQEHLKYYTIQYSDGKLDYEETRLQFWTKDKVNQLLTVIESVVIEVNKTEIQEWLSTFAKDQKLVSQLGNIEVDNVLTGFQIDFLTEINLENFKLQIRTGLQELKKKLHSFYASITCEEDMIQWKDKPHELLKDLIGCTEQCPFCGEQCDLLDPNHYSDGKTQKHRTEVHRPSCLAGQRDSETQVMTADYCTSLVASRQRTFKCKKAKQERHPYKEYEAIYPEWSIPPDPSAETCLYWKWFVAKYSEELAITYDAEPANVPKAWSEYEWTDVERNLKEAYKIW